MQSVPDFGNSELWVIKTTLRERYGREIDLQMADTDIRLHPQDRELTTCPALYWQAGDAHFVIIKSGERHYRCQFYYRLHEQFGTSIPEYEDITECVVSLLQTEADNESVRRGDMPERERR